MKWSQGYEFSHTPLNSTNFFPRVQMKGATVAKMLKTLFRDKSLAVPQNGSPGAIVGIPLLCDTLQLPV